MEYKILTIIFYYPQAKQVSLFIYKPNAIDYTKRVGIKIMQKRNQKETTQNTALHVMKIDRSRADIENTMLIVRFVAKRFGNQKLQGTMLNLLKAGYQKV